MKKILSILLVLTMLLGALILPVSATEAQVPEVLGASIRTTGSQGLRFVGRIKKEGSITLTTGTNANFGFLIIPESSTNGSDINKDTPYVKNVPAVSLLDAAAVGALELDYSDDYYYFSVVQKNIPANFYNTRMVVKAYVNNGGTYTYSNSPAKEKRSIQYVAQAIQDQGGEVPAFVTAVLTTAAAEGSDIYVNADAFGVLDVYPEYPAKIDRDGLYTVSVTQGLTTENLVVYNECAAFSHWDPNNSSKTRTLAAMDSNRRFCEFAFEYSAVTVNIQVNKKFTSYVVSPTSKGFASSYSNGVISVTLEKPEYFVVILDDDYNTALSVFADHSETDIPTKGATNVVYVEGNSQITLPESQASLVTYAGENNEVMVVSNHNVKIYLAPGAILEKRLFVARPDTDHQGYNVKVYGRGAILDPFADYNTSNPNQDAISLHDLNGDFDAKKAVVNIYSYGFTIKDVKVLDGRDFNILFAQSSGSKANNVKILSTEMSTDGFMVTGNHEVKNSFVYCGDNALVMGGGSDSGTYYENITIGTTCAALYPQYSCHSTLKDIYVFRADDDLINVHENNSGAMTMDVDGLDAIDCVKTPLIFGDNGGNGSDTKTFNLKNVVLRYTTGSKTSFTAGTYTSQYDAMECSSSGYIITFTNLYIGGHRIGPSNDGSTMKIGSYYIGENSACGDTISGMTINFAYDSTDTPAHTSIPAANTANYTSGAAYVVGPIRGWSRFYSPSCTGYISGGQYKVTTSSVTSRWGYMIDLTEQIKSTGAGTYNYSVTASKTSGTTLSYALIKCANNSNSYTKVKSTASGSFTVSASDVGNYTYHFVVKGNTTSAPGTITLTAWSFSKS